MAATPIADPTAYSELDMATKRHFMPIVVNQLFTQSPILHRIFKPAQEGSWGLASPSFDGRAIVEPLETAEATGTSGAYGTDDTWTFGSTEVLAGAHYTWKMYYAGVKIHNANLAMNTGAARIYDLAAIKLRNASKTLRKDLITDFYLATADGNIKMVGMQAFCAANLTVGGIAQGGNTYWQGYTEAISGDLTWEDLNEYYYKTKLYGDYDAPTIFVTTDGAIENYEKWLTKVTTTGGGALASLPLVGIMGAADRQARTIDGGFESFSFKRIPMVADPYCPSGMGFFINERYLHWRVLKQFQDTGWTQQRVNGNDWVQNTIFGYGALTSSCNKKHALMTGLTEIG